MINELEYMNIEYGKKDIEYIDSLICDVDKISKDIVAFFGIEYFGNKVEVKLYDNLKEFRELFVKLKYYEDIDKVPKWACGCAYKDMNTDIIATLSFMEYIKTKGHENDTINDLKYLVLHEFVHSCHIKLTDEPTFTWLKEGLATTISHQYDNAELIFDLTLEGAMHGGHDYRNYHTMFSYVYDTYGREYILTLVKNFELLKQETPRLYIETKNYVDNIKKLKFQ